MPIGLRGHVGALVGSILVAEAEGRGGPGNPIVGSGVDCMLGEGDDGEGRLLGLADGATEGVSDSVQDGAIEGLKVEGLELGLPDGEGDGCSDGNAAGWPEGASSTVEGATLGINDGGGEGSVEGFDEG